MGMTGPNTLPLNNDKQHAHQVGPKGQTKPQTFFKNRMSWHGQNVSSGAVFQSIKPSGGARRDRTDDLMLAKHALSQLSYGPTLAAGECMFALETASPLFRPKGGKRECAPRLVPDQRPAALAKAANAAAGA